MNVFQIVLKLPTGIEILSSPIFVGQTIQWVPEKPAILLGFQLFLRKTDVPAMAVIVRRNGVRMSVVPQEVGFAGDTQKTRFHVPEVKAVAIGDEWKVSIHEVHHADLANAKPCEFCGAATFDLYGDPVHEEPVCEPWMSRDREQRMKRLN